MRVGYSTATAECTLRGREREQALKKGKKPPEKEARQVGRLSSVPTYPACPVSIVPRPLPSLRNLLCHGPAADAQESAAADS
ncbi:hypothetical protein GQ600_25005 [Phytophthora cactorum]|nr:hypothetical protein GQ600_25005 [Phytophthora cactorum]